MNVSAPILDVVPGARGQVLQTLCQITGPAAGREVARRAGVPVSSTAIILADLVRSGIVIQNEHAHAHGYQLNRKHLLSKAIIAMAQARTDLVALIRRRIDKWTIKPIAAWMYGSTARGDGDRASDIDLLFVVPDGMTDRERELWEEHQVAKLQVEINDLTSNFVSYLPHTVETFMALEARRTAFTVNLHADGIDLMPDSSSWRRISQARSGATA